MTSSARLHFDISTYWHAGTGRGRGGVVDAVTYKDIDGLPRLPGRTVKGLVRDAVAQAEALGWPNMTAGITDRLFGRASEIHGESTPGLLRFSDALLPEEIRSHLCRRRELIPGLYRTHFSTAIDANGSALEHTLRGIEVTVPLQLCATVSLVPDGGEEPGRWFEILATALPLIQAVGAHRTRGFGRVRVTLEADA